MLQFHSETQLTQEPLTWPIRLCCSGIFSYTDSSPSTAFTAYNRTNRSPKRREASIQLFLSRYRFWFLSIGYLPTSIPAPGCIFHKCKICMPLCMELIWIIMWGNMRAGTAVVWSWLNWMTVTDIRNTDFYNDIEKETIKCGLVTSGRYPIRLIRSVFEPISTWRIGSVHLYTKYGVLSQHDSHYPLRSYFSSSTNTSISPNPSQTLCFFPACLHAQL